MIPTATTPTQEERSPEALLKTAVAILAFALLMVCIWNVLLTSKLSEVKAAKQQRHHYYWVAESFMYRLSGHAAGVRRFTNADIQEMQTYARSNGCPDCTITFVTELEP